MSTEFKKVYNYTKNLTVLYVEDDKDFRLDTADLFEKFFAKVDTATDGSDGLEKYLEYYDRCEKHYDIVITDLLMAEVDGLELVKEIYSISEKQPIIVLSAHNESEYLLEFVNIGIEQFIVKPFDLDRLLGVLYSISHKINNIYEEFPDKNITHLAHGYSWDNQNDTLLLEDKDIKLTKRETLLMKLFIKNGIHITTLNEIFNILWDDEPHYCSVENLSPIISRLRKKIPQVTIQSSYGMGYKLIY
ncbi:MAG: response regulator transcription factor [Campylobacterota bacterium]|nr:response regulator transcription factor [Campylobacterota bacterium]